MLNQLIVELTNDCNGSCVFCPHRLSKRDTVHMDILLYEKIIKECAELGFATPEVPIGLCGIGEPLTHPEFKKALEIAYKHKVPIGVGSNGNLINNYIDALIKFTPQQVVFSIDAMSSETHKKMRPGSDFDCVESGINEYLKKLRKSSYHPKNLWVQILVSKYNIDEVVPFIETWLPKIDGISGAKIFIKCICPWPYKNTNDLYPSPKPNIPEKYISDHRIDIAQFDPAITFKESCTLFDHFAQIMSNGNYSPCCMAIEDHWNIGNANKNTVMELFNSSKMNKLRKMDKSKIPLCMDCI